ncbi:MotA/TolQ/ExbB proton channel family protein [Saccharophagus degradans]|uniref:MotA/TolQ/ExbB proton channel family protein n=1 Tax=Saccharophagus degradans TaxID=86304 RepID=UPI001C091720|nr:MotA/TolQ/ExbB proton channel family protein [Saccharophagus degradans]MBU2986356.1 MotA/TolQ/ExbB proton channel family protein [Saccharophagus degradans]
MKMTITKSIVTFAAAAIFALSGAVSAQSNDKAASLDELLKMVKDSKISETAEYKQREADFRRKKSEQASLLKQAEQTRTNEENRSARLEAQYKEQELAIQQKRAQFEERLGSLKELFGHLTSTAGDLRSNMDVSIVSAQYPGRTEFLDTLIEKMNSETKLPTIEEVERLWYETQREVVESGKIVKFQAEVASPSGDSAMTEVVRVGNYNLIANGAYLVYDEGKLQELPMDNQGRLTAGADAIANANSGFVKLAIDPTGPLGGNLLKALVINSKGLKEYYEDGGLVGTIILSVGAIAILIALWRFFALQAISSKVNSQLKAKSANPNNPLGRILKVAEDNPGIDTESLELKLEEAILKERPAIESWLGAIKIISMIAPLMGLLGTVTGMIVTFEAITIFGAGDPKNMASGISGALMTTVMGLIVAIPTVLLHTWLNGKAKHITHVLDEQSAGIIAEKSEQK